MRHEPPPMPVRIDVALTVRDTGGQEVPVARLDLVDVVGDTRQIDLDEDRIVNLILELAGALAQLRRGAQGRPWPW